MMVRGKGKKEFLSPAELQMLKEEQQELLANKKELEDGAGKGTRGSNVNAATFDREIERIVIIFFII